MSIQYKIHVSNSLIDPEWDLFVFNAEGGCYYQTTLWGRLKEINGWKTCRIKITLGNVIIAGAQILFRAPSAYLPFTIGIIPKGPVIHPAHLSEDVLDLLFDRLEEVIHANRMAYLALQPSNNENEIKTELLKYRHYHPAKENISPTCDVIIDLQDDLDTMFSQMRRHARHHVRQSKRYGVTVREGDENDLSFFLHVFQQTSKRQGFLADNENYVRELFTLFNDRGWIKILLAEDHSTPLSSMLLITFGDTVIHWRSGWCGNCGNMHPNEALYWGAIEWGKNHGYRFFSLGGISSEVTNMDISGDSLVKNLRDTVSVFKLGFGGRIIFYPGTYACISNPLLDWGYHKVYPLIEDSPMMKHIYSTLSRR